MERTELQMRRAKAVDYMKAMGLVEWSPKKDIDLSEIKKDYRLWSGVVYHGLPYVNEIDSSLEEFQSYVKNGVYTGPVTVNRCIGVDCSSAVLAAWGTVVSSFDYVWTMPMMPYSENGSLPVGDYVVPAGAVTSTEVVEANDLQTLYQSYAKLQPADAVISYTKTGHVRMVAEPPMVRLEEDGTISEASTVVTHEIWSNPHIHGTRQTCWFLDRTYTFQELKDKSYIPVTCREFATGQFDPLEFSLTEPILQTGQELNGCLRSNYRIYEVEAVVCDPAGNVLRQVNRHPLNTVDLKMVSKSFDLSQLNGALNLPSLSAGLYALTLRAKAMGEWHSVVTVPFAKQEQM